MSDGNQNRQFVDKKRRVLQNKAIDSGQAKPSNFITLPAGTTAELAALENRQASIAYDTTLEAMVLDTGSGFGPVSPPDAGADVHLSNLEAPTAIPVDLIFDTGIAGTVQTQNSGTTAALTLKSGANAGVTGDTGAVILQSGAVTASDSTSGAVIISSGLATGGSSRNSGDVSLTSSAAGRDSGNVTVAAGVGFHTPGVVTITTGNAFNTSGAISMVSGSGQITGAITIASGTGPFGTSGDVNIATGTNPTRGNINLDATAIIVAGVAGSAKITTANGGSPSSALTIKTGDGDGSSGALNLLSGDTNQSGDVSVRSGYSIDISGDVIVGSGDAGVAGASGLSTLMSGNATGPSGNVAITSGNSDTSTTGNITIQTGTAVTTRGSITLDAFSIVVVGPLSAAIASGNTAGRPGAPVIGQMYFDTDLGINGGQPIWYTGAAWVDAAGIVV